MKLSKIELIIFGVIISAIGFWVYFFDPTELWNEYTLRFVLERGHVNIDNPFLAQLPSLFEIIKIGFALFSVNFLGYSLFRNFLTLPPKYNPLIFFGSFILGLISSIPIIRIVSLFVPHTYLFFPVLLAIWAASLVANYWNKRRLIPNFSSLKLHNFILPLIAFFVLLFILLVFGIQFGDHPFSGHGDMYSSYIKFLNGTFIPDVDTAHIAGFTGDIASPKFLPIIRRHYDEILFNVFLSRAGSHEINPIVYFWITNTFTKISLLFMITILLKQMGASLFFSLVSGLFLIFGTTALNPQKYFVYFDSYSPLFVVVNPARVYGPIVLAFLLVIMFFNKPEKISKGGVLSFCLLGLGLASGPIHTLFLVYLFIGLSLLFLLKDGAISLLGKRILIPLSVMLLLSLLGFQQGQKLPGVYFLLAFLLGALLISKWLLPNLKKRNLKQLYQKATTKYFITLIASSVFSLLFLGNVFSAAIYKLLNKIGVPSPLDHFFTNAGLTPGGFKAFVYNPCSITSEYCQSPAHFFIYYGLILIFAWIGTYLLLKFEDSRSRNYGIFLFTCSLTSLLGLFFYANFINQNMHEWVKTRFFEAPFYIIIFLFLWVIGTKVPKFGKAIFALFATLWIAIPMLSTQRIDQFRENLYFLVHKTNNSSTVAEQPSTFIQTHRGFNFFKVDKRFFAIPDSNEKFSMRKRMSKEYEHLRVAHDIPSLTYEVDRLIDIIKAKQKK